MSTDRRYILGAELRADAGDGSMIVEARAVKYGALSQPGVPMAGARERIAAGCFRDSLASGSDVVALWNHDQNAPLGRLRNGTLTLQDTKDALNFTVRLNPKVQSHRDLHQLVADGTVADCSFAFSSADDDWSDACDERGNPYILRTVKSAKLHDVSLVLSPAYGDGATTAQARSLAYRFTPKPRRTGDWSAERAALVALDKRFAADRLKAKQELFKLAVHYREIKNAKGETIDFEPVTLADLGITGITVAEYRADQILRDKAEAQGRTIRIAALREEMGLE